MPRQQGHFGLSELDDFELYNEGLSVVENCHGLAPTLAPCWAGGNRWPKRREVIDVPAQVG
jgi:hypothetical protein